MSKLYQFGTMQMLVESLLDGFVTPKEILSKGDIGIGTGEGIDGELIILNGKAYKVDVNGKIIQLNDDFPIVFANIHQSDFHFLNHFDDISLKDLRTQILNQVNTTNLFFSVLISGDFSNVKTRSAAKSTKPYPGLAEIAKHQTVFKSSKIQGHMIGYFTPILYQGAGVPNYHQHFISNNLDFGGHVLDAYANSVDVKIQIFNGLDLTLPVESKAYKTANLNNLTTLNTVINNAE